MGKVGRIEYSLAKPGGKAEYFLTDHLGSLREIYDFESGNVTFATHYYPYGLQFAEYNTAEFAVTKKFTGKEKDDETRLNYFGARYYDPEINLWVSPDPARFFHSLYSYSGNGYNPINSTDPDGKVPIIIIPIASGATIIMSTPTAQQFAARLPAMATAASTMITPRLIAFQAAVHPHMKEISIGLGVLFGIVKQRLPDHDLGATELPAVDGTLFGAGQAAVDLAFQAPGMIATAARSLPQGNGMGYGRTINFEPDATATSSQIPLRGLSDQGQSIDGLRLDASTR